MIFNQNWLNIANRAGRRRNKTKWINHYKYHDSVYTYSAKSYHNTLRGCFGKIAISWALHLNENFYCDVNIIASSSFQTYRFIEIHTTALCAFYTLCVLRHRTSLYNLKLITKKFVRKTDKCTNAPLKDTCADIG